MTDKGQVCNFSGILYVTGPIGRWGVYLPAASIRSRAEEIIQAEMIYV